MLGEAPGERGRMGVADAVERDHVDELRRRGALRLDERRVGARGAAHRLRGVVDQDVQRALRGDGVGERDDLSGVAQVDADDAQPVQPVGAVGHRGEAAHGVVRKAGGDGRVGAVAEQSQRDVHADLGAATGEQRAPAGEVGAGVALGAVERGALRAELVVERVDHGVVVLADVAGARPEQGARGGPDRSGHQRQACGLVVDAAGRTGGGGGDDGVVGGRHRVALGVAAGLLHRLEDAGGGPAHGDGIGVLGRQRLDVGQHLQADVELVGVDRGHVGRVRPCSGPASRRHNLGANPVRLARSCPAVLP